MDYPTVKILFTVAEPIMRDMLFNGLFETRFCGTGLGLAGVWKIMTGSGGAVTWKANLVMGCGLPCAFDF